MPKYARLFIIALVIALVSTRYQALAAGTPSIEAPLTADGWWVIGPFLSGTREAGVDPLAFDNAAPSGVFDNPLLIPGFPSVLVRGGVAHWRYYDTIADGVLSVDYPEVSEASMKLVIDEWGAAGGSTVGYAITTVHVTGGPRRALLELKGAGSVSINGVPWPGDPYGNGMGMQPVLLQDGDNQLKVGLGGSQRFTLRFLPVEQDLLAFMQAATLPDAVRGQALPALIGLPVANTTMEWMTVKAVGIKPEELYRSVNLPQVSIPPLCVANLALELAPLANDLNTDYSEQTLPLKLKLDYGTGQTDVLLNLEVKDAEQARRVTFRSAMDNSVQYYGLLPPSNFDPQRKYGLILSLHGAGVDGIGQASAYRPKDWAYVAAPTNRRPFGFDWQDWGQRDMLEVLAEVQRTCSIDENRIHLTGHSMGGHGTWLNALTFPDLWASAAPSAGWTRFDLYSPMFLRRNLLYGDPKANYIWQLAMRQDDTLALCENAKNLPIYALEGGADDNVPPQQPRLLVERLLQLGCDVTYKEVPAMGHWWDDGATPGTDCVDSAELNAFWENHVRNPWPKEVVFKALGGKANTGAYWISAVPQQLQADLAVRAKVVGETIVVSTVNAEHVFITPSSELMASPPVAVVIDGDTVSISDEWRKEYIPLTLRKYDGGHWSWEIAGFYEPDADYDLKLATYNWKDALMQPCMVVVPSGGMVGEDEWCLQLARLYAYNWWYRGNGALTVMTDMDALAGPDWNGSLICLGTPGANKVRNMIAQDSPLAVADRVMDFGGWTLPGEDVTYKFITPYWTGTRHSVCLVEGGTSLKALKRLAAMQGIYSGAGFPDWMVWDDEVKLKGMAGVLAMGFFGLDWRVDPELSFINEDLIAKRRLP